MPRSAKHIPVPFSFYCHCIEKVSLITNRFQSSLLSISSAILSYLRRTITARFASSDKVLHLMSASSTSAYQKIINKKEQEADRENLEQCIIIRYTLLQSIVSQSRTNRRFAHVNVTIATQRTTRTRAVQKHRTTEVGKDPRDLQPAAQRRSFFPPRPTSRPPPQPRTHLARPPAAG